MGRPACDWVVEDGANVGRVQPLRSPGIPEAPYRRLPGFDGKGRERGRVERGGKYRAIDTETSPYARLLRRRLWLRVVASRCDVKGKIKGAYQWMSSN